MEKMVAYQLQCTYAAEIVAHTIIWGMIMIQFQQVSEASFFHAVDKSLFKINNTAKYTHINHRFLF